MPNFMSWSSDAGDVTPSGAAAQNLLERRPSFATALVLELDEACARLLERRPDEVRVLALLRAIELALDVAQVELLLRHHALERLDVLTTVQGEQVRLELVVREPLDRIDRRERDDPSQVGRHLLEQLPVPAKLLGAAREVALHLHRHGFRLDAEPVDPVGEDARVTVLVAVVDLHGTVELALRLHLAEQALQTDHASVLADAVLLQDQRMGARMVDDFTEAGEVDVDGVVASVLSHRFVPFLFGGPAAAPIAPRRTMARALSRRARSSALRASRLIASGSRSHWRKIPSSAATEMTARRCRWAASGTTLRRPVSYMSRMPR